MSTLRAMDTLKILLGATVALLLGALAVSWKNLQTGEKNASQDELAKLQRQIEEIRRAQDDLAFEKQRLALQEAAARPTPSEEAAAEAAKRAELEAQIARYEEEKAQAERDAKMENQENAFQEGMEFQKKNSDVRRARMIRDALLIARINEWIDDGDFGTIELVRPENVQPGSELLIRRNTGVLGKLRVERIEIGGGIVNPVTQFGEVKPQRGDELILEPPFFSDGE